MRWQPASGLGVIALTNHRYGPVLLKGLLDELLRLEVARPRRTAPNAATRAARDTVEGLLSSWDDAVAAKLLAMNVELDEPLAARRAFVETLRERHGVLTRDEDEPTASNTPYHLVWWLRGSRGGRVKAEILLSPELPPKVQTFALTSVQEPPPELWAAAERIVAATATPESGPVSIDWPSELTVGADVDLAAVVRAMRAAEARFAPLTLGRPIEGDGERKATYRLESARGRVDLALTMDPARSCLDAVALTPVRLVPPELD
jgi:hypothetical protein